MTVKVTVKDSRAIFRKNILKISFLSDLDTIAEIYVNGIEVSKTENMFSSERVDVTQNIQAGLNRLNITIAASVPAALEKSKNWPLLQPPQCPDNSQTNGQCHINMLRKAGYSYRYKFIEVFFNFEYNLKFCPLYWSYNGN